MTLCPSVRRSPSRRKAQTWSSISFHSVGNRSQVVVAATTAVGLSAVGGNSTAYSISPSVVHRDFRPGPAVSFAAAGGQKDKNQHPRRTRTKKGGVYVENQ